MEKNITGEVYKFLLETHLLPFIESLDENTSFTFQDDNAPVYRATAVVECKKGILISSIPWPAQSPELNPIEHLWDHLGGKVHDHKLLPKIRKNLLPL